MWNSLLLSLLFHAALIFGWTLLFNLGALSPPKKDLAWFDNEQLKTPKKQPIDEARQKKVVQTEAGEKLKNAPEHSFLGWQNQEVDRQTVSKRRDVQMGGATQKNLAKSHAQNDSPSKQFSNLGIPFQLNQKREFIDQPDWATPGVRPQDYVPGVQESDMTALNTHEFQFYGYFQRIRERLDRAWVPLLREKLTHYYQSGRHLAAEVDHRTKVIVILNMRGEIVRVEIIGESGTRDLDDAAVAAFNKAGPFPNPPKGMVDVRGEVKIPWDFVLKT